jgi:transposase-like protein
MEKKKKKAFNMLKNGVKKGTICKVLKLNINTLNKWIKANEEKKKTNESINNYEKSKMNIGRQSGLSRWIDSILQKEAI